MRIAHLAIVAGTALTVFVAGTSAIIAQPGRAGAALLRPLSESDMRAAQGSGCEQSFDAGRSRLIYVVSNDLVVRTAAGRSICHITEDQFNAMARDGRGRLSCGGVRIAFHSTGRATGHQDSDSASAPAILTATARGRSSTARGRWGTAC